MTIEAEGHYFRGDDLCSKCGMTYMDYLRSHPGERPCPTMTANAVPHIVQENPDLKFDMKVVVDPEPPPLHPFGDLPTVDPDPDTST